MWSRLVWIWSFTEKRDTRFNDLYPFSQPLVLSYHVVEDLVVKLPECRRWLAKKVGLIRGHLS